MFFVAFLFFFLAWVLLSGMFDPFHLSLGVLSSLIVTFSSYDLLFMDQQKSGVRRLQEGVKFIGYFLWLLKEVIVANFHVFALALHPRMLERIDPQIVRFQTKLTHDVSKWIFANSITLTPGTVTVRIEGDTFIVHAISSRMASSLPGEMEQRIALVFEPEVM